jgi:hypothetical protein
VFCALTRRFTFALVAIAYCTVAQPIADDDEPEMYSCDTKHNKCKNDPNGTDFRSCSKGCDRFTCDSVYGHCLIDNEGKSNATYTECAADCAPVFFACDSATKRCVPSPGATADYRDCSQGCDMFLCDTKTKQCRPDYEDHKDASNYTACTAACV